MPWVSTGSLLSDGIPGGHGGVPAAVYTCAPGVCVATSDDRPRTWKRYPANPVIASSPEGFDVTGFRDPYAWKNGGHWYLLVGSGTQDLGGALFLYRSKDLR